MTFGRRAFAWPSEARVVLWVSALARSSEKELDSLPV
jgi:hypothetical protein